MKSLSKEPTPQTLALKSLFGSRLFLSIGILQGLALLCSLISMEGFSSGLYRFFDGFSGQFEGQEIVIFLLEALYLLPLVFGCVGVYLVYRSATMEGEPLHKTGLSMANAGLLLFWSVLMVPVVFLSGTASWRSNYIFSLMVSKGDAYVDGVTIVFSAMIFLCFLLVWLYFLIPKAIGRLKNNRISAGDIPLLSILVFYLFGIAFLVWGVVSCSNLFNNGETFHEIATARWAEECMNDLFSYSFPMVLSYFLIGVSFVLMGVFCNRCRKLLNLVEREVILPPKESGEFSRERIQILALQKGLRSPLYLTLCGAQTVLFLIILWRNEGQVFSFWGINTSFFPMIMALGLWEMAGLACSSRFNLKPIYLFPVNLSAVVALVVSLWLGGATWPFLLATVLLFRILTVIAKGKICKNRLFSFATCSFIVVGILSVGQNISERSFHIDMGGILVMVLELSVCLLTAILLHKHQSLVNQATQILSQNQ